MLLVIQSNVIQPMKRAATLVLFFAIAHSAFALRHDPKMGTEHSHHQYDTSQERTWKFADMTIATKGTFLLAKQGRVWIELNEGVKIIDLEELSWIDRKYVSRKLKEIQKINDKFFEQADRKADQSVNWTPYASILALALMLVFVGVLIKHQKTNTGLLYKLIPLSMLILVVLISCSSDGEVDETPTTSGATSFTSDPTAMNAAFTPYNNVNTRWDNDYFYVESQGIPDHQMMVGITAWIAQVPTPHDYTGTNAWQIPLTATYAENPITIESNFQRGAIGIASNGIPIFNPLNASGLVSQDIGELDAFGGHSGRGDDYHYHTAPMHLETTSGLQPIAYALDGFAVFGSKEPDGTDMAALDAYHGHEYDDTYHYHGTDTYPYMVGAMRGEVSLSGTAPQSQIEPQPTAQAFRGDPHPINSDNLVITNLEEKSSGMGYVLTYTSNGIEGSVDYSWDENNFYTFIFNDIDGSTTTETFQK